MYVPPSWYTVLRGKNMYNEAPEIERIWVQQGFCAGIILGAAIAGLICILVLTI